MKRWGNQCPPAPRVLSLCTAERWTLVWRKVNLARRHWLLWCSTATTFTATLALTATLAPHIRSQFRLLAWLCTDGQEHAMSRLWCNVVMTIAQYQSINESKRYARRDSSPIYSITDLFNSHELPRNVAIYMKLKSLPYQKRKIGRLSTVATSCENAEGASSSCLLHWKL